MDASLQVTEGLNTNQPSKQNRSLPKNKVNEYKIVCTHLIDGVYQGFVNASYQRDGFGILQTEDFQTYIGYFKYNKPNGLGLIIYTDGSMIYANFRNGQLSGIGLSDNGHQIQIGTFKQASLVGIGFEYSYKSSRWKMNSYHKGVSIQVIKQQAYPLEEGVPNFIAIESEILAHYLNYNKKKYFSKFEPLSNSLEKLDINQFYIHQLAADQYYFGTMIQDEFYGLGLIYDTKEKKLIEAGTYREGVLHGYGIRTDPKSNIQERGFFKQGRKQGVFYINQGGKTKFPEFKKGTILFEDKRGQTIENIKKAQKIYYYRQKDFLSTRNNLRLHQFQRVFQSSEYKAWKIQEQNEKKQQKTNQMKANGQAKTKAKSSGNPNLPNSQGGEKTSIQIMKEKIFGLMTQSQNKKHKNNQRSVVLFQKENQDIDKMVYEKMHQDDEIASQENPIVFLNQNILPMQRSVTFQKYQKKYN